MHEDLLGYLLGALEPDEMKRVAEWLRDNPEGQEELARLERNLRPLEEDFEAIEPPSEDLLQRTLDGIPEGLPPQSPHESAAAAAASPVVGFADADLTPEPSRAINRWRAMDSVGGLLAVAVLLALLLPSIAAGRSEARKVACADNLRVLHTQLMQYVDRDHQRRLPEVAASGPEAFAGIYAVRLADAGLLHNLETRWCPSVGADAIEPQRSTLAGRLVPVAELPSVSELTELSVNELRETQRVAGGNYAYTLGVIADDGSGSPRYESPRFESRSEFAVMADAPINEGGETRFAHGDRGINVLYEDGAVRFIRVTSLDTMRDHPLLNHDGVNEAGVNIDDASLAPSWRPPFTDSVQR
ncbi:MAG: hypothetical protein AAFX06_04330 [Planctomycetota bacterium]